MKKYIDPELEVVEFSAEDVIVTSPVEMPDQPA